MEKRALIAVAIAFAILLGYQFFFMQTEPQQVQQPKAVEKPASVAQPAPVAPGPSPIIPQERITSAEEKRIKVDTDLFSAVFSTKGATLAYYDLRKDQDKDGRNVQLLKSPGAEPPLAIGAKDDFGLSQADFRFVGRDLKLDKNNKSGVLVFEYSGS